MTAQTEERPWTIEELSEYLRIPVPTLYGWRKKGKGPRARRIGKHLRYLAEDVYSWLRSEDAA